MQINVTKHILAEVNNQGVAAVLSRIAQKGDFVMDLRPDQEPGKGTTQRGGGSGKTITFYDPATGLVVETEIKPGSNQFETAEVRELHD